MADEQPLVAPKPVQMGGVAPKSKAKKAKAKSAIQKERARQKAKREDEQPIAALIEEALPNTEEESNY